MINAVVGVSESAMKCNGPPAVTPMVSAKVSELSYDYEGGSFKVRYED
jgi:hypothetical protein